MYVMYNMLVFFLGGGYIGWEGGVVTKQNQKKNFFRCKIYFFWLQCTCFYKKLYVNYIGKGKRKKKKRVGFYIYIYFLNVSTMRYKDIYS